jgi:hypothetical protein
MQISNRIWQKINQQDEYKIFNTPDSYRDPL